MKKIFNIALATTVGLTLAACGSDSSSTPAADPATDPVVEQKLEIGGNVVKGTLLNAKVEVFSTSDLNIALTETQTDGTDGTYTLNVEQATTDGAYVIQVSADADTTMVCDAAMCGTVKKGEVVQPLDLEGLVLKTVVYADGATIPSVQVNALTTMATEFVINSEGFEDVTAESMATYQEAATSFVAGLIGLNDSDTLDGKNIFSQVLTDASVIEGQSDDVLSDTLSLINGSFSGMTTSDAQEHFNQVAAFAEYTSAEDYDSNSEDSNAFFDGFDEISVTLVTLNGELIADIEDEYEIDLADSEVVSTNYKKIHADVAYGLTGAEGTTE